MRKMKLGGDLKLIAVLLIVFALGFFVRAMNESNMSMLQAFTIVGVHNGLSAYGLEILNAQIEQYQ